MMSCVLLQILREVTSSFGAEVEVGVQSFQTWHSAGAPCDSMESWESNNVFITHLAYLGKPTVGYDMGILRAIVRCQSHPPAAEQWLDIQGLGLI